MERNAENGNSLQRNTCTNSSWKPLYTPQESGTALMTSRISNTMHALLIIIKDPKTASLNELFILFSSSLLSSSGFCPHRLLIFRLSVKPSHWGAFRDTSEISRDACQTIYFQPGWSGWPSIACYMLHATSAEGTSPHFLKGEIVDTVLRTNQTLLKARKHAF